MSDEDDIFADALEVPVTDRAAFLENACRGDSALRARVDALLRGHDRAHAFLEVPLVPRRSVTSDEKPGDLIGRYKLLQKIGEGGCGVVYMAEQEEPVHRRVALKVIKLGMDTKAVIARFSAERQALALMEHPNIARVFDAGATDTGRPFFVMELVRGVPITRYCDENNLPASERLKLFIQVCRAIHHAHQKGIIHRDIKPSNVLITQSDDGALPKIIDFGIAKATQGRLTDQTLFTAFEQFIGTPAYMSPEQAEFNAADVDARSDVYSLGVLLYELLTGRPPFDPKTLAATGLDEIRRTIREVEPARPSTRLTTLDDAERITLARQRGVLPAQLATLLRGDLDWIVMKALEKSRVRRYESASALALDGQRFLDHEPIVARPPSQLYRLQKFISRHRVACGASAAMLIVLALGATVSVWQAMRATRAERTAALAEAKAATAPILAPDQKSVAVLPFENLPDDKENEYFSDGISEELLNVLARVPGLRVAGRTSSFYFKGKNVPIPEIAQKLGVAYVIEGSVRKAGTSVRITAQLVSGADGFRVWPVTIERELKDIFALQDEIAHAVAQNLQLTIGSARTGSRVAVNPEVYRLFLEGRQEWNVRHNTSRADALFRQALALDPKFAPAIAGFAATHQRRSLNKTPDAGTFRRRDSSDFSLAIESAQAALAVDPDLADAYVIIAEARKNSWQFDEARKAFQHALALDRNLATGHHHFGLFLLEQGYMDEALTELNAAAQLDPLAPQILNNYATTLGFAGKWEEGITFVDRALSLIADAGQSPSSEVRNRLKLLVDAGRTSEAVPLARKLLDKHPLAAAHTFAKAGLRTEAEAALGKVPPNLFKSGGSVPWWWLTLTALGRQEEILATLDAGNMDGWMVEFLLFDPNLDPLRNDPRYLKVISELGLTKAHERAQKWRADHLPVPVANK